MPPVALNVLDLSQNWDINTPGFARYDGPTIKWVKRVAFDGVGGMEITSTLHVGTHLDAPNHFITNARGIGELPIDFLVGPACVVDLQNMGLGDYQIYGPEHFERWEQQTGITIERGDILVIHTGYHRFYPANWTASCNNRADETRYHQASCPTRAFADWVKARGIRWLAVDAGSADHPMNTVIRQPTSRKCAAAWVDHLTRSGPTTTSRSGTTNFFRTRSVYIERRGEIDRILDQRVTVGCFPGMGGEAASSRGCLPLKRSLGRRPPQRVRGLCFAAPGDLNGHAARRARRFAGHGHRPESDVLRESGLLFLRPPPPPNDG
jgi:kynurenine formamidase